MSHILIVGKVFSGIKDYLVANNYTYTVLQDRQATKYPEKRFKHRVVTSFEHRDTYLAAVDAINSITPINGVITVYENYVVASAIISQHLGVPGLSEESAIACTDKEFMRQMLLASPMKISPGFAVVSSKAQLVDFTKSHSFPLILKPANLSKSLLVSKSDSLDELIENYEKALSVLDSVYEKYAHGVTPKLIVEEFLEGSIHSVDAFIDRDGTPHVLENVVDYQTGYDIGYDDNFHYSRLLPSRLSQANIEAIRKCAKIGCRSLGMTSSPAHVEIILTKHGPRIVEIGARNGGYRERMHMLANDIDIIKNTLALSLNKPLDIKARAQRSVGVFELFPRDPGTYIGIKNEQNVHSLSSFIYMSIKAKPGSYIGKSGDGYKMAAVVILANPSAQQFDNDSSYLSENVFVQTSSVNKENLIIS